MLSGEIFSLTTLGRLFRSEKVLIEIGSPGIQSSIFSALTILSHRSCVISVLCPDTNDYFLHWICPYSPSLLFCQFVGVARAPALAGCLSNENTADITSQLSWHIGSTIEYSCINFFSYFHNMYHFLGLLFIHVTRWLVPPISSNILIFKNMPNK